MLYKHLKLTITLPDILQKKIRLVLLKKSNNKNNHSFMVSLTMKVYLVMYFWIKLSTLFMHTPTCYLDVKHFYPS